MLANFYDFVYAGLMVNIDMADTLTVTKHRNAFSSPLDISDQFRWTTGNDEINHLLQPTQVFHLLTCAYLQHTIQPTNIYREQVSWHHLIPSNIKLPGGHSTTLTTAINVTKRHQKVHSTGKSSCCRQIEFIRPYLLAWLWVFNVYYSAWY